MTSENCLPYVYAVEAVLSSQKNISYHTGNTTSQCNGNSLKELAQSLVEFGYVTNEEKYLPTRTPDRETTIRIRESICVIERPLNSNELIRLSRQIMRAQGKKS